MLCLYHKTWQSEKNMDPVFHTELFAGGGKHPQTEDLMHDVWHQEFLSISRLQKVFVTTLPGVLQILYV